MNQLILGDNLEILKKLDSESVDLMACKVVDNNGLENLEVIKLKVNGVVERN